MDNPGNPVIIIEPSELISLEQQGSISLLMNLRQFLMASFYMQPLPKNESQLFLERPLDPLSLFSPITRAASFGGDIASAAPCFPLIFASSSIPFHLGKLFS